MIEGDDMYGVGALDMKSGCAAIMLTLAKFAEEHLREGSFRGQADISSRIGRRGTVRTGYGIYHK